MRIKFDLNLLCKNIYIKSDKNRLDEYNRPNDKISEMLKSGELTSLRRGL
jgi:hypothetical protein